MDLDNADEDTHNATSYKKKDDDPFSDVPEPLYGSGFNYKRSLKDHHHKTMEEINKDSIYTNSQPDNDSMDRGSTTLKNLDASGVTSSNFDFVPL
jgi:hypothetical protein